MPTPEFNCMKALMTLILSCASLLGADTNAIRVSTSITTNVWSGAIYTTDVFTRDGQTNLIRWNVIKTGSEAGTKLNYRVQRFYHDGLLVCEFTAFAHTNYYSFMTQADSSYSGYLGAMSSKGNLSVVIGTKDGLGADSFTSTDGLFYPDDSSTIRELNRIVSLNSSDSPKEKSPEDFIRWIEKLSVTKPR